MRALLSAAALVALLAGSARGDGAAPSPGAAGGPWFAGAYLGYGALSYEERFRADGAWFLAEGGRTILPWFWASMSARLSRLHGLYGGDPTSLAATEIQLAAVGPRLYFLPLPRIRIGVGFGMLRQRKADTFLESDKTSNLREISRFTDFYAGGVPYRSRAFEIEVGASRGTAEAAGVRSTWYCVGVGLRWR